MIGLNESLECAGMGQGLGWMGWMGWTGLTGLGGLHNLLDSYYILAFFFMSFFFTVFCFSTLQAFSLFGLLGSFYEIRYLLTLQLPRYAVLGVCLFSFSQCPFPLSPFVWERLAV
jgi:hypothetical protein